MRALYAETRIYIYVDVRESGSGWRERSDYIVLCDRNDLHTLYQTETHTHTPQTPRHTIITKLAVLHGTLYRQTETKLASSDKNAARTHKRTHRDEKATKPQPCAHVRMGDTQKNPPVHPESGIVHDWLIYKQREKRYMQISDETRANPLARLVKKGGSGRRRRLARGHRAEPAPGHDDRGHVAMLRGRPQLEPVARAPVCKLVSRATLLGVIHADRRQVRLDAALGEGTLKPYMILRAAHLPNAGLFTRQ